MAHFHDTTGSVPAGAPAARHVGSDAALLEAQLPVLRQKLIRHARFVLNDPALAEDLVQDTLLVVMQEHGSRRGESSLTTWATAILKNRIADWYRSPARRRQVQLIGDGDDDDADPLDALFDAKGAYAEPVPAWQQPENHEEQRQMMTILERCVGCMSPKAGRVFMMREWLGFDTAEICERMGVSAENCRMILHRARMSMRSCMQRDWVGAGKAAARNGAAA